MLFVLVLAPRAGVRVSTCSIDAGALVGLGQFSYEVNIELPWIARRLFKCDSLMFMETGKFRCRMKIMEHV